MAKPPRRCAGGARRAANDAAYGNCALCAGPRCRRRSGQHQVLPAGAEGSPIHAIVIHAYRTEWPAEFAALRSALAAILGPLALRIDHIGSTSMPELGAKDVIDIQVTAVALAPEIIKR